MKINGRPQRAPVPGPGAGDVVSMKSSAVDICISSFICVLVRVHVRAPVAGPVEGWERN